jgi:iron complex outermembrane receptor protein
MQVPGTTNTTFVNGGGAIYKGIEFEGQYALGAGLSTYANYTINAATYNGSGVTIAESPNYTAAVGVMYDNLEGPYASLIGKLIGPRYGLDNNGIDPTTQKAIASDDFELGSSFTLDLAAGYRFNQSANHLGNLTVSVKVSNLLNNRQIVDYGGNQSATSAQFPNGAPIYWTVAGRSVFLNLSASLY